MNKYVLAVWEKGLSDPEYEKLYRQMYDLEAKFEEAISLVEPPVQDAILDYVMHCEAMSWRMLEFACEHYEARK